MRLRRKPVLKQRSDRTKNAKAVIGYHEIAGHTTPSELRALVERLVPAD